MPSTGSNTSRSRRGERFSRSLCLKVDGRNRTRVVTAPLAQDSHRKPEEVGGGAWQSQTINAVAVRASLQNRLMHSDLGSHSPTSQYLASTSAQSAKKRRPRVTARIESRNR